MGNDHGQSTIQNCLVRYSHFYGVWSQVPSRDSSIFQLGFFGNRLILWGIGIKLLLLVTYVYPPVGHLPLGTWPRHP